MKLSDFILLDIEGKKLAVLHGGVLVAKRNSFDALVFLFQFQDYYVEAFCNRNSKAVEEFRAFEHSQLLDPYLSEIAIEELLN